MSEHGLASDCAMVMAAGFGTRMRPLTDSLPKPLVQVAGKPLIDYALDWVADAGVSRAVVNVHYLADMLEAHLQERERPAVTMSDERAELLETGGGMVKAQGKLADPFFCLNSDNILINGPRNSLLDMSAQWNADQMDALLLLVEHSHARNFIGDGDFDRAEDGKLSRRKPGKTAPYIYTGVQLVSHRLLRDAPEGKFSTNILWDRAIEEGRLYGATFSGQWFEVGTPEAIAPTEAALQEC